MATLWEMLGIAAAPQNLQDWAEDNPSVFGMPNKDNTMTVPSNLEYIQSQYADSLSDDDIQSLIQTNVNSNGLLNTDVNASTQLLLDAYGPGYNDPDPKDGKMLNLSEDGYKLVVEDIKNKSEEKFTQTSSTLKVGEIQGDKQIDVEKLNWNSLASSIVTPAGNPSLDDLGLTDKSLLLNQQQQKPATTVAEVKKEKKNSLFGNMSEEKRAMLIMWLNSMRLEPDPGINSAMQERLKLLRANKNKSGVIATLVKMGRKDLADMVSSNTMSASDAIDMAYKDKELKTKDQTALRKEFQTLDSVKDISKQVQAFGRVIASAEDPSAAGDLALIFNYMKILDPGSTVREGEFANAQNSGGVDDRVIALYNSLFAGTRLSQVQRDDFINRASRLYSEAERQLLEIRGYYVKKSGMEDEAFAPPIRYTGDFLQGTESLQEQIKRIKALKEGKT